LVTKSRRSLFVGAAGGLREKTVQFFFLLVGCVHFVWWLGVRGGRMVRTLSQIHTALLLFSSAPIIVFAFR
jgi:hypothetical protein